MNLFPTVRPRPTRGPTSAHLTVIGSAAFVLLVNTPWPAAAQQPPRRFFVLTMDAANAKKASGAKDALAVIERDGTSWVQFAPEIERAGR
ncbi:MAG: hypothetical protein ACLQIB_05605 [Isosphaeraceae bacterium]